MAANQTTADMIAALYQQYLAGGTIPELWQGQVNGPSFSGMSSSPPESDGGAAGFAELGQGILDYLGDEDEDTKEKTEGILNQSAWTPKDAQQPAPNPPGQMAPQPATGGPDNSPVTSSILPPPAGAQAPPPGPQAPPQATPEQTKAATNVVSELSFWLQKMMTPP